MCSTQWLDRGYGWTDAAQAHYKAICGIDLKELGVELSERGVFVTDSFVQFKAKVTPEQHQAIFDLPNFQTGTGGNEDGVRTFCVNRLDRDQTLYPL